MGWGGAILALLLPWLAGALWVRAAWRDAPPGVWPLALGYGGLLGLLSTTLLMRAQGALGLPLQVAAPSGVLALIAVGGGWRLLRQSGVWFANPLSRWREGLAGVGWPQILFLLLFVWLAWRFGLLAMEVWWRPVFAWDAWTTWAVQSRVWAELGALTSFIDPQRWLADTSGSAYTIEAWRYPVTVPLLALWPTLAYGSWNETAANLPWLALWLALGFGFYGQARLWGTSALTALGFTWLLLSLPVLNTHVALAGYADLWVASAFGLAAIAFFHWIRFEDPRQGILALLLMTLCPLIKQEGAVWLLTFIPAFLAARLPLRGLLALAGAVLIVGVGWWLMGGLAFEIPGLGELVLRPGLLEIPYLGRYELVYRGVWAPLVKNFLVLANWHLFAYLLPLALVMVPVMLALDSSQRWLWAEFAFVAASLALLFVLFFMTEAHRWAEQYTSINRVFLDFVPALMFWVLTVFQHAHGLLRASFSPNGPEAVVQSGGTQEPAVEARHL